MSETFATLVKLFAQVVQTLKARCLDISGASDPRAQTPEMSTMGPYTMRYKRSVHRVAGGICLWFLLCQYLPEQASAFVLGSLERVQ